MTSDHAESFTATPLAAKPVQAAIPRTAEAALSAELEEPFSFQSGAMAYVDWQLFRHEQLATQGAFIASAI